MTPPLTRREALTAAGLAALASPAAAADPAPGRMYRVGVISAAIRGKPQRTNGHTFHFANYFHPTCDLDALQKLVDPGSAKYFRDVLRNPNFDFDALPFLDTRISHYYDADAEAAAGFCAAFPGCKPAKSPEELAKEVDAVWLGDASGFGEDHFDLIAPALERGLPTFCDKPIGGTVAGTRKILETAQKYKAPLMSASIFRYEWGTAEALRLRDSGEHGPIQYVLASMGGGYTPDGWRVYGQHPIWMVMTLMGAGVEAVSLYAREKERAAHGLMTYKDRMPGAVWYGRPDIVGRYNHTTVYFSKRGQTFEWTPEIAGNFPLGHHYEMFKMAAEFRKMMKTRIEPVPHQEILEVTACVHAGAKSAAEKSRLVELAEVMQ